jgi:hypothetical protein
MVADRKAAVETVIETGREGEREGEKERLGEISKVATAPKTKPAIADEGIRRIEGSIWRTCIWCTRANKRFADRN